MKDVIAIATQAGQMAQELQKGITVVFKEDNSLVTPADFAVSEFLIQKLSVLYPKDVVFTEEHQQEVDWSGRVWIVDPIDGTRAYARGDDDWAVCIGLLEGGVPVFGVVCAPSLGWTAHATKGKGAFFDKERICASNIVDPQYARGYVTRMRGKGFSYLPIQLPEPEVHYYSAAAKIVCIASGRADAYLHLQSVISKWDTAAAQIILEESGGKITALDGTPLKYAQGPTRWETGVLASNGVLHDYFTTLFLSEKARSSKMP